MKLLRAEFQNFRLLRDLELKFSTDTEKNLTVIRAANESGKTTILHGLQWALYGDEALPAKGDGFRLHPIDWNASETQRVPIKATVEFEVVTTHQRGGMVRENRRIYRLVRSAFEDVDSQSCRSPSTVKLFELKESGTNPIDTPEAQINDELPPELREVFFTDGDRALSFIESNVAVSTKRERVQRAIRSLLGLGVIDDAIKHVRKSATEVNKKAKRIDSGGDLKKIASRLETIEKDREKFEADLEDSNQQFEAFNEKIRDIESKISEALQKGDKEKLRKDIDHAKIEIKQFDDQIIAANKDHSALFRSRSIAIDLLAPVLTNAFEKLEELREQGKIPSTTIPVLQDRLKAEICICGETLQSGDPSSNKRRAHIQGLIDDSQRADKIQEIITSLYFGAKSLQVGSDTETNTWPNEYSKIFERRAGLGDLRDKAGRKLRALEAQIDTIPDTDIRGLRDTLRQYRGQRDRHIQKQSELKTQITGLQNECSNLEIDRNRLLREQVKGEHILAELNVTQDVTNILQSAYERITNEELNKVSDLMNRIFLEMIGADPDQGAIIQQAEISPEFDIIVYGPNNRTLNPDRDLNGASRRALTLAFILALTKVSEVEAPNVIDTPLGMTSGYVKRSILSTAVRESAQIILFLTHDEIAGCEEIIDKAAGLVFTLTNPAHYPKMLVNDPEVTERKVLRCDCDHRGECHLCLRHHNADISVELETTS